MVADDPTDKIELKIFHNEIQNDHDAIKREEDGYREIPGVRQVSTRETVRYYGKIKADIVDLIESIVSK